MKRLLYLRSLALATMVCMVAGLAHGAPRHIYLTYSGAPETSIDINIVFPRGQAKSMTLHYDVVPRGDDPSAYAHTAEAVYHPTTMELSDRRSMYVVALTDLKPGTDYHFLVTEESGNSTPRKFRTLPGGTAPLRFVNGGDMSADESMAPLLALAAKNDPDFVVIGGDIAYVNGLLGGYAQWDQWLDNWDQAMVTSDGRMVPMVTAIGNHETNRYPTEDHNLRAPWYMSFFGRQGDNIYYTRHFGDNLVLFLLDTGHLVPHDGAQKAWLESEMKKNQGVKYKFAAYHVPLYPAHRPFDGGGSVAGRTHWGPIFDQYGLTVGLEHHDHVLKRTKPLKGGEIDEQGTVYIGDGCFGRSARTIDPEPRWYNHLEGSVVHFWVVDVTDEGLAFKAIDDQGNTRDEFTLP